MDERELRAGIRRTVPRRVGHRHPRGIHPGLGAEWMFAQSWSAKVEYDYLGFGNKSYDFAGFGTTVDAQVHLLKVGVNYQLHPGGFFGWF